MRPTLLFFLILALSGCNLLSPTTNLPPTDSPSLPPNASPAINMTQTVFTHQAQLQDVAQGNASGIAKFTLEEDTYQLLAEFSDLPSLEPNYFYQGWIVKPSPQSVIDTGRVLQVDGKFINLYTSDTDYTDHTRYVLTLEPEDGNPEPDTHILEGEFIPITSTP